MTVESVTTNEQSNAKEVKCPPLPVVRKLPSAQISSLSEVQEIISHYVDTSADFGNMDGCAEATDPVLYHAVEEAFTQARFAVYQQIDACCAHVVAKTLMADRKYRQEQRAKRGSHRDSDTFTALLSDYADAVHCFREAQAQEKADCEPPEERRTSQVVRQAEQAIDAFLEAFYAEESGLKE